MKYFIAFLFVFVAACSPDNGAHEMAAHDGAAHDMTQKEGIVISDARVRPPLPGRDIATAYFHIQNFGAADQLVSVTSPLSERIELHTHLNEDGVMKMRRVDGVDLPKGEAVMFKPGGLHVMMFGVTMDETVEDAALTLNFKTAPSVTVIAEAGMGQPKNNTEHSGH